LWTKGTWRDFKLSFPLHHFSGAHAAIEADMSGAAASNGSVAADEDHSSEAGQILQRWLPAEYSTPQLKAALQGYEGVSLSGALAATSGSGAPHAGAKLSAGRVVMACKAGSDVNQMSGAQPVPD
jgi:hypothetical protein